MHIIFTDLLTYVFIFHAEHYASTCQIVEPYKFRLLRLLVSDTAMGIIVYIFKVHFVVFYRQSINATSLRVLLLNAYFFIIIIIIIIFFYALGSKDPGG